MTYEIIINSNNCYICESNLPEILEKHHLIPLCEYKDYYKVTQNHIILLCPSCHTLLHKSQKYQLSDHFYSISTETIHKKLEDLRLLKWELIQVACEYNRI